MSRSLGIISDSFALRSRAFALGGHVFFSSFDCHFDSFQRVDFPIIEKPIKP